MQFFTLGSSKIAVFETCFFDIVITYNDLLRYVKHVLGRFFSVFTLFGYWAAGGGGGQTEFVHNLLMQFFSVYSSLEASETYVFGIVIT